MPRPHRGDVSREENARDPRIKTLVFSRRFGQPAAIWGGLSYSTGQAAIVIDCDLQDPPGLIPEMVRLWREGYKVVLPQRRSRGKTLLRRSVSYLGYKVINHISTVPIPATPAISGCWIGGSSMNCSA